MISSILNCPDVPPLEAGLKTMRRSRSTSDLSFSPRLAYVPKVSAEQQVDLTVQNLARYGLSMLPRIYVCTDFLSLVVRGGATELNT